MSCLSPHFHDYELACRFPRHRDKPLCNVSPRLLGLAEKVCKLLGVPMAVTLCCRCPEHNREEGGTKNSKHICTDKQPARAMDFKPRGIKPFEAYRRIVSAYRAGRLPELGGIGLYDTFLHIDAAKAENGYLRTWNYRKEKG